MTSPSLLFIPVLYLWEQCYCKVVDLKLCQIHWRISDWMLWNSITTGLWCWPTPLRQMGLKIPVTSALLSLCLLLRSAFNLYCRFMGIHRRDEGHGLTFVYFKGYALPKCCCFAPCGLGERDRDVWPDFSPSTNALWKPSLGRHGNAFSGTHYSDFGAPCLLPPASQSSSPCPMAALFVCSAWLNTCSPNPTNMFTNRQSQVGVTGLRKLT